METDVTCIEAWPEVIDDTTSDGQTEAPAQPLSASSSQLGAVRGRLHDATEEWFRRMSTATRIESEAEELERHLVAYDTACDKYDMLVLRVLAEKVIALERLAGQCEAAKKFKEETMEYFADVEGTIEDMRATVDRLTDQRNEIEGRISAGVEELLQLQARIEELGEKRIVNETDITRRMAAADQLRAAANRCEHEAQRASL